MRRIEGGRVFPVTLGERERAILTIIARQEDRFWADMIRIAIREAAERRGVQVDQAQAEPVTA